jgi:hypothetical protein
LSHLPQALPRRGTPRRHIVGALSSERVARSPHTGLPIPRGGSLSLPLGDAVDALARIWRETRADEVARRLVKLADAHAAFFSRLPKKGPLFFDLLEPRIDRMLVVLLRSVTRGTDEAAADRLLAIWQTWRADPRLWPYLERWTKVIAYPRGSAFRVAVEIVLDAWASATGPGERALTESDRTMLGEADALIASLPKRRAAFALLNDVYLHPTDVARRLVLADALLDLGDPWGELIAIQNAGEGGTELAPASSLTDPRTSAPEQRAKEREAELLRAGRRAWLGRLLPWVNEDTAVFEGGFPAQLATPPFPRAAGITEWGTVHVLLDATRSRPTMPLFTHGLLARMPRLRRASILVRVSARRSTRIAGRDLRHLTVDLYGAGYSEFRTVFEDIARSARLPCLERFDLATYGLAPHLLDLAVTLFTERFGKTLRELGFNDPGHVVIDRSARLIAQRRSIPTMISLHDGSSLALDAEARTLTLKLSRRVDMNAIGAAVQRADVAALRVEATADAWPVVEARRWRNEIGRTTIELVRV